MHPEQATGMPAATARFPGDTLQSEARAKVESRKPVTGVLFWFWWIF